VFYFEQAKFELMESVSLDFSWDRFTSELAALVEKRTKCRECIDMLTDSWLDRCLAPLESATCARGDLRFIGATVFVATTACEMKHMLGQEVRKPKSRGAASKPIELGKRSYQKSVGVANRTRSEHVLRKHIGSDTPRSRFGRMVCASQLGRVENRRRESSRFLKYARTANALKRRSAWGAYQTRHWAQGISPCGAAGLAERARLRAQWDLLVPAARAPYIVEAAKETDAQQEYGKHLSENFADVGAPSSKSGQQAARRRAFHSTLARMQSDEIWQSGTAIEAPWLALREELLARSTRADVETRAAALFGFDPVPVRNPPGSHPPETPCGQKHGGLSVGVAVEYHLLLDIFGKGELQVLMQLYRFGPELELYKPVDDGVMRAIVTTTHLVFARMIRQVAIHAQDIEAIRIIRFEALDAGLPDEEGLVIKRGIDQLRLDISTQKRIVQPRAKPSPEPAVELPFGLVCDLSVEELRAPEPDAAQDVSSGSERSEVVREELLGDETCEEDDEEPEPKAKAKAKVAPKPKPKVAPKAPPPVRVMIEAGVQSYEFAVSSHALCYVCNQKILTGDLKLIYQIKRSTAFRDTRSVHALCAPDLPVATRRVDHRTMQNLANDAPPAVQEVLENVASSMNPDSAKASSA